jgi:hypothetical protein
MLLSNLLLLINFYIRLQFTESTHGLWCTWPAIYRAHAVYILRCLFSEFKHGCGNQLPMLPWRAYFHPISNCSSQDSLYRALERQQGRQARPTQSLSLVLPEDTPVHSLV